MYFLRTTASSFESLTCVPTPGVPRLHPVHPGLVPGVGKVHQQHQLDQDEGEGSARANDKPRCNNRHTRVSRFKVLIIHQHMDVLFFLVIKYEGLTVGKRPVGDVEGTDCDRHQGSKLKEPKPENKLFMHHYSNHTSKN